MIYWLTREDYAATARKLTLGLGNTFTDLQPLSYERVFYKRNLPKGHYIFTDFDRLSQYEIECAISATDAIRKKSPASIILNDPRWVLERVPLLTTLYRAGLNDFEVTRLDNGDRPDRFPVFVRSEDDYRRPFTGLISSAEELEESLTSLREQGRCLKRRIAVGFCAETDPDGFYRKYGVFKIREHMIPQHILRGRHWMVKSRGSETNEAFANEELNFVRNNPHQEQLREIFKLAHIDFGRIDYTIVGGRVQTFEINTNPTFPNFGKKKDVRSERREIIQQRIIEALEALQSVGLPGGTIRFSLPKPFLDRPRIPRRSGLPTRLYWAIKGNLKL